MNMRCDDKKGRRLEKSLPWIQWLGLGLAVTAGACSRVQSKDATLEPTARSGSGIAANQAMSPALIATTRPIQTSPPAPAGHEISGRVLGHVGDGAAGAALPDVAVTLTDPTTGQTLTRAATDLGGRFTLPRRAAGSYSLCLSAAGMVSSCTSVALANAPLVLGDIGMTAVAPAIVGSVLLSDGSACNGNDGFFGLNYSASVQAYNKRGLLGASVRANRDGEFLLGGVTTTASVGLRVSCESLTTSVTAQAGSTPVSVSIANRQPSVDALWAGASATGSAPIGVYAPGATVIVSSEVSDPDGDALTYIWRAGPGSGTLTPLSGGQAQWTLPSAQGRFSVYLRVGDGKGGYGFRRLELKASNSGAMFSGSVIDDKTGNTIAGATVTVNGAAIGTTSSAGIFSTKTVTPAARYAVSIHKAGYAPHSEVVTGERRGVQYRLSPAQTIVFDPNRDVELIDTRPELEQNQRSSAHILLPAGTLNTKAIVEATIKTILPDDGSMPGDYSALDSSGKPQSLVSYGAVFAEFKEQASGAAVNVAKGKLATLRFPLDPTNAKPPASIALWTYDEQAGVWQQGQAATLRSSAGASYYEGTVPHFSTVNADDLQPGNKCLRVRLDPALVGRNLRLEVTLPTPNQYGQVFSNTVDRDEYQGIVRLPATGKVQIRLFDEKNNALPLDLSGVNVLEQEMGPIATPSNAYPDYPYAECGAPFVLGAHATAPGYAERAPGEPHFLTGISDVYLPALSQHDLELMTSQYYKLSDPHDQFLTLQDFWSNNGFDPNTGAGGVRLSFLNNNDLGSGRDMHCTDPVQMANQGHGACYVTNYGAFDQNPKNAVFAANNDADERGATVGMIYYPSGANQIVSFFVYPADPTVLRQPSADLDGFGPKPVPQLCTVCHGGKYDPPDLMNPLTVNSNGQDDRFLGSKFREFDADTYQFPTAQGTATSAPSASDLSALSSLNQVAEYVAQRFSYGDAIAQTIDAWYPNGFFQAPDFEAMPGTCVGNPVSTLTGNCEGWFTHDLFVPYQRMCRTCHIAQEKPLNFQDEVDFRSAYDRIRSRVCGPNAMMPNSIVTFKNGWDGVNYGPNAQFPYRAMSELINYADLDPSVFGGHQGIAAWSPSLAVSAVNCLGP
jgi:hypothetical protein